MLHYIYFNLDTEQVDKAILAQKFGMTKTKSKSFTNKLKKQWIKSLPKLDKP